MIPDTQLDALIAGVPAKTRIMPSGVRKWIPASAIFSDVVIEITDEVLADIAANLNSEGVSIPIDGGSRDNVAHESAPYDAFGWAHRAAVLDGDLFLESEVLPVVAGRIDEGRLAYSSIDIDFKRDESGAYVPGSAHLITHALTNTPKNRGMQPIQAVAQHGRRLVHSLTRARLAQETTMATKKADEKATETASVQASETKAAETPAMSMEDALAKIAELEGKLSAMEAAAEEMSAQLASVPAADPEAEAMKARETAAISAVDTAIKEGRFSRASREKMLAMTRKVGADAASAAFALMPARSVRVTSPVSAAPISEGSAGGTADAEAAAILERQFGKRGAAMAARIGKVG